LRGRHPNAIRASENGEREGKRVEGRETQSAKAEEDRQSKRR
jgi:hypothetical protein